MRALASDLGESSNAVRLELNRLQNAGMLMSYKEGNKKLFQVNNQHPLFEPINTIIKQHAGVDHIISNVLKGLGSIDKVYLTGSLANGLETNVIDIILIGDVNNEYLLETVQKIERGLEKEIRCQVFSTSEAKLKNFNASEFLLIYEP